MLREEQRRGVRKTLGWTSPDCAAKLSSMSTDTELIREGLERQFTAAGDARLKQVGLGDPDAAIMAQLLAGVPGVSLNSSLRYLAPGRSGAKVVVLVDPENLPVVVKFGVKADIDREESNYKKSHIEQRIAPEMRPTLWQSFETGGFAALVYSWAGARDQVTSFREFFRAARPEVLEQVITRLMDGLFLWHNPRKSSKLPFDLWQWDETILPQVLESIQAWNGQQESKQKLTKALLEQTRWRDQLLTKHCSVGYCHGDLNCYNVVISKADSLPKIIDFASVLLENSPARDYAKLERDIKLRCLRDLIETPTEFVAALEQVDNSCSPGRNYAAADTAVTTASRTINTIRSRFRLRLTNLSDIPSIEYLYFLFCWTLAYLSSEEGAKETKEVRDGIIDSAERILDLLDSEIIRIGEPDHGWVAPGVTIQEKSAAEIIGNLKPIKLSYRFRETVEDIYIGRWTREPGWQATVEDLPRLFGEMWLCSFVEVGSGTLVWANTVQDASKLRRGDSVTVSGKISGVSPLGYVSLDDAIVRGDNISFP